MDRIDMNYIARILKYYIKTLVGLPDRSWPMFQFERSIHEVTKKDHDKIITEAEAALKNKETCESDEAYAASPDLVVLQGYILKKNTELKFSKLYEGKSSEQILIHVPDPAFSPAGYSLFTNLAESLNFIGIRTQTLGWHDNTEEILRQFKPTIFLSSDHASYLERIDWGSVRRYRGAHHLQIGLTASLAEYDNTPLSKRLDWASKHGIDFFYSFRDENYVNEREEYKSFFDAGYKMIYLPFGANILHYYPMPGFKRDIDFVLIASKKSEHAAFIENIARRNIGFIDGPGWKHAHRFKFNRDRDRYIYTRAKAGLNVHLPEQIDWDCEVNERTYQLAACGVPQIIDHPKLLDKLFSKDAMFIADTPSQYSDYFKMIINDPKIGQERALIAQKEVFDRHTTFHRADSFMQQLNWDDHPTKYRISTDR